MTTSPLLATYRFAVQGTLAPSAVEHLRTYPGVQVTRRGEIRAPYSAGWLVAQTLQAWGAAFALKTDAREPRPWSAEAEAELRARIEAGAVRPWLSTGDGGPWKLLPFQLEAIWFALERDGGFLVEPPGAGKTVQGCVWLALDEHPGAALVITKTGVVKQFTREIEQFLPTTALELRPPSALPIRDGVRLTATQVIAEYIEERREAGERPVVVVGWGAIKAHLQTLLSLPWRSVIYDECHLARSEKRLKWAMGPDGEFADPEFLNTTSCAAWRLACQIPRRLAMTATPIPDRRRGLWGQVSLVEPHAWGQTWGRFVRRYCDAEQGQYGLDTSGTSNDSELTARLSFTMHRVPREVTHAQLPPVRTQTWYVPPERQDRTSGFRGEAKRLAKLANGGDRSAKVLLREHHLMEAAARKRSAVLEVLEEHFAAKGEDAAKGKVILFTGRHKDAWELSERIQKKWGAVDVFCGVDGVPTEKTVMRKGKATAQTSWEFSLPSADARMAMQDAYMAHPGPCVLVGTGKAWGTGLNLHDTDLLGIVMLPYEPGDLAQWRGRINRLGQTRPCTVMLFVATGTVDEHVAYLLSDKTPDIEKVIGDADLTEARDSLRGIDDLDAVIDRVIEKARQHAVIDFSSDDGWRTAIAAAKHHHVTQE